MKTKRMFTYVFLIIAALISIFPFIWMVISATNQSVDVTKGTLLPGAHLVKNINNLLVQWICGRLSGTLQKSLW